MTSSLSVLIDSNIFIAAADHPHVGHVYGPEAAELLRITSELGYRVIVSHGTRADIARAGERRVTREKELSRFYVVPAVPLPPDLAARAGFSTVRSPNDEADLEVLATFVAGLGNWLVTNDATLRRRAKRVVGDPDRVYSLPEVLDVLRRLRGVPTQMPAVHQCKAFELDLDARIFDSLKADYPPDGDDPGFEGWWRTKVVPDERPAIILGDPRNPEGLVVLKHEDAPEHGLSGSVIKLCTFKVDDDFAGTKRGESLLKAVIDYARRNSRYRLFLEVLPALESLSGWLESFGFEALPGVTTRRGELVYVKHLQPPSGAPNLPPHEHAVAYGPGSAWAERIYLVPIQARWHSRLLPEAEPQLALLAANEPCGNAIRKAYLCHANIRRLLPGDLLLFVRTDDGPARATCTGVVDDTSATSDPDALAQFAGSRTVYSQEEMESMCTEGEVLAIRFRLDRVLQAPLPAHQLVSAGAMMKTPQQTAAVRQEGMAWLRAKLGV